MPYLFLILLSLLLLPACSMEEIPLPNNAFEYDDAKPFQRELTILNLEKLKYSKPTQLCNFSTADEVLASCPTQQEMLQIRNDFNIYFDKGMVDNNAVIPWSCTQDGDQSSTMLTMYNSFRLMQCIPFDSEFPWAPGHQNLYEWLKSAQLQSIGYFWAQDNEYSHGWNKKVYLRGNEVSAARYREVIESQSGTGLIDSMILLIHETRHASVNIGHNCGYKDSDLIYMGAWAVQHYLDKMLADNTGSFFTYSQKAHLLARADTILATRFCN